MSEVFTCNVHKNNTLIHTHTYFLDHFLSHSQAIDSIHQVGVYCLALVPANTLPKAPLGGIHISETKQRFLEGALHPCNVLMCPHTCVTNLPKPRQKQPGTGESCVSVGWLFLILCIFCTSYDLLSLLFQRWVLLL